MVKREYVLFGITYATWVPVIAQSYFAWKIGFGEQGIWALALPNYELTLFIALITMLVVYLLTIVFSGKRWKWMPYAFTVMFAVSNVAQFVTDYSSIRG